MNHDQRGVALITVLLALLILTVLGIAASLMMTQESRTASRQDLSHAAFYAAEAGLRQGEQILSQYNTTAQITALLGGPTGPGCSSPTLAVTPPCPALPTAGSSGTWTVANLGCYLQNPPASGTVYANQAIAAQVAAGAFASTTPLYSLYVRNNPDDRSGSATIDADLRVQLISVGWVASSNGTPQAVKILSEEYSFSSIWQTQQTQKGGNQGSTGSAILGR